MPEGEWNAMPHMSAAGALVIIAAAACATATQRAHAQTDSPRPPSTAADVRFMTGMIRHHAQAVLIAGWAPTHGAGPSLRLLCERIVVGQRDEIASMQRWLRDRHEDAPDATMPGMEHSMLMPGMLTAEQLAELDAARGPAFDRLFLTFMIQHHRGAITMVGQLFSTEGAAQDGAIFRFANDVNVDQLTEIDRMSRMLAALSPGAKSP
jgi:uncharacterized protein (DUF305 family)